MRNLKDLVRPNIWNLKPYSSARSEFKGSAEVFLDANESPYESGLNRYPDPLQVDLKAKIAPIKKVPVENIFMGNGSDEAIDLLFRIFCEPKIDRVITLPPTYGMYQVSADIADVRVVEVLLTKEFQIDVAAVLEAVDEQTKLIFLCSPNNPTGNSLQLEDVKKIIENFDGIVVVDEAYIDFSSKASLIPLLEAYKNLVILQTFSKAWGLAGVRCGLAFASEEIIALFNKVKAPYNLNELTQRMLSEVLEDYSTITELVNISLSERTKLEIELLNLKFVEKVHPSDANFLLVKVTDARDLYTYLLDENIIVRDRSKVVLCDECLRITIGTVDENAKLLEALEMYAVLDEIEIIED